MNGQWAFALWDTRSRQLILSRDRTGILPLFWTVHAGVLRFASEVKALFADPSIPREFSPDGLDEALTFWASVAPLTPFRGVQQLPPGVTAVFEAGAAVPRTPGRVWPMFSDPLPQSRLDDPALCPDGIMDKCVHGGAAAVGPPARGESSF